MDLKRYDLVFHGEILDGFDLSEVKDTFARSFSFSKERVDLLFRRDKTRFKSDLDARMAKQYRERFARMGMKVTLEERDCTQTMPSEPEAIIRKTEPENRPCAVSRIVGKDSNANEPDDTSRRSSFQFSGNGREYFGIWIVNHLLSILTLGIYSAWAKVRNKQYFYGNTELEGARFEYTANPKRILVGRIVAFVFFVIFSVMVDISIHTAIIAWLVFLAFLPWAVRQALRFNARYSSYRNIPFRFTGSLGGAFMAFIVWPLLAIITFGFLFPMAIHRQQRHVLDNHAYGTQSFEFTARVVDYYKAGLVMLACFAVGVLFIFLLILIDIPVYVLGIMGMALYLFVFALFGVYLANLKFNHTLVGGHGFHAYWKVGSYFRMLLVNTLATVFTLGMFFPWARVRSARYAAEHIQAVLCGDLDHFIAAEAENTSALAEGISDIFDMDVGV